METKQYYIPEENLQKLVNSLIEKGADVLAPVRDDAGKVNFNKVTDAALCDIHYVQSVFSAKLAAFPPVEKLFEYTINKDGQKITDSIPTDIPETVLFATHPCDAAAFSVLKAVFTWDTVDAHFMERYNKLTVISMACTTGDAHCFCTSVGSSPDATAGSDIMLTTLEGGGYIADILTEKGVSIFERNKELFTDYDGKGNKIVASIEKKFELSELQQNLEGAFENPVWAEQAMRCLGCGACAYVCPTCSCYDIQDEGTAYKGKRLRCWDTCALSNFTMHTSGHNPREGQPERWRQRILHKFAYQPERLSILGCVGCGRCSRGCPADMNIVEHLQIITQK
ncbi:MAG: 4Fe-4S dicluster domain-containing protein [Bacteroidota bacterium]